MTLKTLLASSTVSEQGQEMLESQDYEYDLIRDNILHENLELTPIKDGLRELWWPLG